MSDVLGKEELERAKLRLEIDELNKPLYRKPAFYAVLGPTLLAAGTLCIGIYTGIFDVKNERLTLQSEKLEKQRNALNKDIEDLKSARQQIAAEVKAAQQKAEAEIGRITAKAEQDIAEERIRSEKIAKAFEEERKKLGLELDPLRRELQVVTGEIEAKNKELAELRIQHENSRVTALLDQISSNTSLTPFDQTLVSLIEIIKVDKQKASVVQSRLEGERKALLKAYLMYILYQGTADAVWLKKLLEFAGVEQNARLSELWGILGMGRWNESDEITVIKFILSRSARSLQNEQLGYAFQRFQLPKNPRDIIRKLLSVEERVELFRLGRKLALDAKIHATHRQYGIYAASSMVPEAHPVLTAAILMRPGESESDKNSMRADILEIRSGFWWQNRSLKEAFDQLEFPKDPSMERLRTWRAAKPAATWTERIMADQIRPLAEP